MKEEFKKGNSASDGRSCRVIGSSWTFHWRAGQWGGQGVRGSNWGMSCFEGDHERIVLVNVLIEDF